MSRIYFSLHEANELVQKIRPRVERVIQLRDELDLLDNTKIEFDIESVENLLLEVELNKNFHEKNVELYTLLGELIRDGCIIHDLNEMEIDFYSKLENKDIAFCWHPNDEKVLFWHYPLEKASSRRSIKEIEKKYLEKLNNLR
ncbi:MAG: DUF2203 family protein [Candidatus Diapherotrites archaeon]|nr:DUF2203 family protein [Candidatus Diapherotrites archaeon]MBT4597248.1 DUF2203 family protein [Candidatus Diapherotrites archaeon]